MARRVLVTGAGGFIAHHLVHYLTERGFWVRAVDIKRPEFERSAAEEFFLLDLRFRNNCMKAVKGMDHVFHLAADMGGIGYITGNHASVASNNSLMNLHMLEAARRHRTHKFLFSSTACVYPVHMQNVPNIPPLKEEDAYPANPEEGYGWEKLYMEKLCQYYGEDYGMETRVVRFHNVYGPLGTYQGGREKSPAAMCRKVALAKDGDEIEVWGDGEQTRSYMHIDDCVEGIFRLMESSHRQPLNLGRDEMVSVNQLLDTVAEVSGKRVRKAHDLTKPQGVRGRNSDNSRIREVLGWEPKINLLEGLKPTYKWIHAQVHGLKTEERTIPDMPVKEAA